MTSLFCVRTLWVSATQVPPTNTMVILPPPPPQARAKKKMEEALSKIRSKIRLHTRL